MLRIKVVGVGTAGVQIMKKYVFLSLICEMRRQADGYTSAEAFSKDYKWFKTLRSVYKNVTGESLTIRRFKESDPIDLTKIVSGFADSNGSADLIKNLDSHEGLEIYAEDSMRTMVASFPILKNRILIGGKICKGLGAAGDLEVGETAIMEDEEKIKYALKGGDVIVIVAGLGGGIGTSGALKLAEWSKKDLKAVTIGFVVAPGIFEGRRRTKTTMEFYEKAVDNGPFDMLGPYFVDEAYDTAETTMELFRRVDLAISAQLERFHMIVRSGEYEKDDVKLIQKAFCTSISHKPTNSAN